MYEHKSHPLIPKQVYYKRVFKHVIYAVCLIVFSLGIGVLGYHVFEGLGWVDSILNASMILGGMGPVNEVHTTGGKLFASAYALFSGIFFLVIAGIIFAPVFHRFLHKFHLESKN
jgi:TRAP-type C4-dicarboxylate transport system permease small subunit